MFDKIISKLKHWFFPCKENDCRPRFLQSRFLYYYAILLLVFKIFIISLFFYLPKTSFFADITKTSLIQLANDARREAGQSPLIANSKLDQAAYLKALDMLDHDYFSHNSPNGITPWFWFSEAEYDYKYAGENLAIGFVDSQEVNTAWLESPSHRKNILNDKYSEIGLAVVTGEFKGGETTIVVQLFGALKNSSVAAAESLATPAPLPSAMPDLNTPVAIAQISQSPIPSSSPSATVLAQSGTAKEVLSAYTAAGERDFLTRFFAFLVSDYNTILQRVIYGSLFFMIFLLAVTVMVDIFVYHAYEIQNKDIFLKTFVLCAIFALLLFLDKGTIISLIPHNLGIY